MKIKNTTDFPSDEIRRIVRFVKPSGVSKFDLIIKPARPNRSAGGWACPSSSTVSISIGSSNKFPMSLPNKGGYLKMEIYNRQEAVLVWIAHELRHLWQYKHPKGWRVWGARGRYSERDADAYALRKLREFRKKGML